MFAADQAGVAVDAHAVTKIYANAMAVSGLDLVIPRGCIFGLLGPNGAGKTTLIKILLGLIKPSAGEICVLGYRLPEESAVIRSKVGYVPERHFIYSWMTVGEVIRFTGSLYSEWNHECCEQLLDRFSLDPKVLVKHLSHGMLAKLALILAMSHKAELILLDEPVANLDPLIREEFLDGLLALTARRQTVLLSSHIMSDVERIADSVGIMNNGSLLITGTVADLRRQIKRIHITGTQSAVAESVRLLEGELLWIYTQGHECVITVRDFSQVSLDAIRSVCGLTDVTVADLALEDIFKDSIRGSQMQRMP